jgi:hypothetical protein
MIRELFVSLFSGIVPDIWGDTKDHKTNFDRETCPTSTGEYWVVI